jgi:hypothetical protein
VFGAATYNPLEGMCFDVCDQPRGDWDGNGEILAQAGFGYGPFGLGEGEIQGTCADGAFCNHEIGNYLGRLYDPANTTCDVVACPIEQACSSCPQPGQRCAWGTCALVPGVCAPAPAEGEGEGEGEGEPDGGVVQDAGAPTDGGTVQDAGATADGGAAPDAGTSVDGGP